MQEFLIIAPWVYLTWVDRENRYKSLQSADRFCGLVWRSEFAFAKSNIKKLVLRSYLPYLPSSFGFRNLCAQMFPTGRSSTVSELCKSSWKGTFEIGKNMSKPKSADSVEDMQTAVAADGWLTDSAVNSADWRLNSHNLAWKDWYTELSTLQP